MSKTITAQALINKAIASPTQELTITAQALWAFTDAIEAEVRQPYVDLAEGKPVDAERYRNDPVYHATVYRMKQAAAPLTVERLTQALLDHGKHLPSDPPALSYIDTVRLYAAAILAALEGDAE